jgi:hypothetical protein
MTKGNRTPRKERLTLPRDELSKTLAGSKEMAGARGLEPAASSVTGSLSNQRKAQRGVSCYLTKTS